MLDAKRDQLRDERDGAIRAAHDAGLSTREIAPLARGSQQRVQPVVSGR